MKRRIILTMLILLVAASAFAQKLTLSAPDQAEVGSSINVRYTLDTTDFDDFVLLGSFSGFEVQYGPAISRSTSIRSINGKTTHSSTATFTYTLMPTKAGRFTLPAAYAVCEGKKVKSGTHSIEVLPASAGSRQSGASSRNNTQNDNRLHTPQQGENISPSDIYFTATASKKHVYEQEAILLTYKLYSLVTVEQLSGDIPALDGFHTQELETPKSQSFKLERVGDSNYGTVVWRQYLIFPQKIGRLKIPAVEFNARIVVQNRYVDPFDIFSGGVARIDKKLKAPSLEIQVDPLPTRPADFCGVVGTNLSVEGRLNPRQVDTNDAATLTLSVSGSGNMQLMKAPEVTWPGDFEVYDPKRTENIKITSTGFNGSVKYDYVAVPHHAGKYGIEPVSFCYFDTNKKRYVTLTTDSFTLGVAKGANYNPQGGAQAPLNELTQDIRHIKTGDLAVKPVGQSIFGSATHLVCYLVALLCFFVLLLLFQKQAKANADIQGRLGRRASKVATRRLRKAAKLLGAQDAEAFYDEVMRALWGYVADKLFLPVTELNKDNVSEKLLLRGVDEPVIQEFLDALGACEFARFAPGNPNENCRNLYDQACAVIERIDETIRKA